MPRVKGIYENGVVRPLEKMDVPEKGEVEILYEEMSEEKRKKKFRGLPVVSVRELAPFIGFVSIGGDAVKDAERYDE